MYGIGATQCFAAGFAEADVARFPLLHQPRHCAYRIFNRYFRINAMEVVEVDTVGIEPPQRIFTRPENILRPSLHLAPFGPRLPPQISTLGREHHPLAFTLQGFGENFFIVAVVVIRRVDEIDSDIDGAMQHRDRLRLVSRAKLALKGRAAVADG